MNLRIRELLGAIRADLLPHTSRGQLVRAAGATVALKVGGAVIAFLASLLYARVLGPHGYGLYAYVIAWTAVLTIPAGLGMAKYLVRQGSRSPESLVALRRWADRRVFLAGLLSGALMTGAALIPQAGGARWLFLVAAPLPLLASMASVRRALLQAEGWIARSQWPDLLLAPTVALVFLFVLWRLRGTLLPSELILATVAAALLSFAISSLQLRRAVHAPQAPALPYARLRDALPFIWLGGLYLLVSRTDLIMLGAIRGAEDAGIYAVAMRAAEGVLIVGMAANAAAAPRISQLHGRGERRAIERLMGAMGKRVLVLTLPVAMALFLFADPLLEWLYGAAYAPGAMALRLLAAAQLLVVAGGSIGTLLNMTGHERSHLKAVTIALVVNAGLNAMLIPEFGMNGAAVATCTSLVVCRAIMQRLVRKHLGFTPAILGN